MRRIILQQHFSRKVVPEWGAGQLWPICQYHATFSTHPLRRVSQLQSGLYIGTSSARAIFCSVLAVGTGLLFATLWYASTIGGRPGIMQIS
jgi:hypothetical protein